MFPSLLNKVPRVSKCLRTLSSQVSECPKYLGARVPERASALRVPSKYSCVQVPAGCPSVRVPFKCPLSAQVPSCLPKTLRVLKGTLTGIDIKTLNKKH